MSWGAILTIAALTLAAFLRIRHEARDFMRVIERQSETHK